MALKNNNFIINRFFKFLNSYQTTTKLLAIYTCSVSIWFPKLQASSLIAQSSFGSTLTGLALALGRGVPGTVPFTTCNAKKRLHTADMSSFIVDLPQVCLYNHFCSKMGGARCRKLLSQHKNIDQQYMCRIITFT